MLSFQPAPDLGSLEAAIRTSGLGLWDYVVAAGILVGAVIVGRLFRILLKRVAVKAGADPFLGDLVGRLLGYLVVAFGFVYSLDSLGIAVAPVLGALGIVGVALAFALQDILANFVAGILLQLRRPFKSGDEIITVDHEGRVLEVDARSVVLLTPTGETVRLPSSEVLKNAIVNHTQNGRRRTAIEVGVAYDVDLDLAADVAISAARSVKGVLASPAPQALVSDFGDSSINLSVRFWHGPSIAQHWAVRDEVARSITTAFRTHGVEIPFPQRVIHSKPAAAAE